MNDVNIIKVIVQGNIAKQLGSSQSLVADNIGQWLSLRFYCIKWNHNHKFICINVHTLRFHELHFAD